MTTTKSDVQASAASDETAVAAVVAPVAAVVAVPVYRDRKFTSRTLILPSGATAAVAAGKIAADTDELLAYLAEQEDFQRIPE